MLPNYLAIPCAILAWGTVIVFLFYIIIKLSE